MMEGYGLAAPRLAIAIPLGLETGGGMTSTVDTWEAELSVKFRSGSKLVTVAVLVIVPVRFAIAVMVTLALAPIAKSDKSHPIVLPSFVQLPWLDEAETNATPSGRTSRNPPALAA